MLINVVFVLGMSLAQVRATCPAKLIPVFKYPSPYYACPEKDRGTVLEIEGGKLVAIMDLEWFVMTKTK